MARTRTVTDAGTVPGTKAGGVSICVPWNVWESAREVQCPWQVGHRSSSWLLPCARELAQFDPAGEKGVISCWDSVIRGAQRRSYYARRGAVALTNGPGGDRGRCTCVL